MPLAWSRAIMRAHQRSGGSVFSNAAKTERYIFQAWMAYGPAWTVYRPGLGGIWPSLDRIPSSLDGIRPRLGRTPSSLGCIQPRPEPRLCAS